MCVKGRERIWSEIRIETEKITKDKRDDPCTPGYKEILKLGNEAKICLLPVLLPSETPTPEERETLFSNGRERI